MTAARRVGECIRETIELLGAFVDIGQEDTPAGTRELIVPSMPYIVVHQIDIGEDEAVVILGVYHGAQLRPGQEMR